MNSIPAFVRALRDAGVPDAQIVEAMLKLEERRLLSGKERVAKHRAKKRKAAGNTGNTGNVSNIGNVTGVTDDPATKKHAGAHEPARVEDNSSNLETPEKIIKNLSSRDQKVLDKNAGEVAIRALKGIKQAPDTAAGVHALAIAALVTAKFSVEPEYRTCYGDDDRQGRIDIVATGPKGGRVAIELDRRSPRVKSLAKLRKFEGYRIVALRGVDPGAIEDIDGGVRIDVVARRQTGKGSRIPDDFVPDIDLAMAEGLSRKDAERTAANFLDYWRAKAGAGATKVDWLATWRMWFRRAASELGVEPGTTPKHREYTDAELQEIARKNVERERERERAARVSGGSSEPGISSALGEEPELQSARRQRPPTGQSRLAGVAAVAVGPQADGRILAPRAWGASLPAFGDEKRRGH